MVPGGRSDSVPQPPRSGRVVLHVIAPGPAGGAETVVRTLAASRHRQGDPTHVAALVPSADVPFLQDARQAGIPVHPIICGHRGYLCEIRGVAELARELHAAVVHTHVYRGDFAGYFAARRLAVPVVATFHGRTGGTWRNRLYQWVDRQLLARFDAVICVSAAGRDWLGRAGVPGGRLHVVRNGHRPPATIPRAEARAKLGLPPTGFSAGWVGRLSVEKGGDLLIEALRALPECERDVVVIGDGPERDRLEQSLDAAPLGSVRVHFAGTIGGAAELLSAFDAVVISSRTEGLPMVLLEAMSAGVPVVAFAVGGIPEVVSRDSAWLVPPGDTRALAAALRDVADQPGEARRRADVAQQLFRDRFNETRWLADLEAVYDWVIRHQV